ncbi:MAG: YhfC family intramembrane metalloprotease [Anaerolineales bacterium]|nr:YhfC family intramembrane metalloprotease [Anaerolineales bacterium]
MNVPILVYSVNAITMIALPIVVGVVLKRKLNLGWAPWLVGAGIYILMQIGYLPFRQFIPPLFANTGLAAMSMEDQLVFSAAFTGMSQGLYACLASLLVLGLWAKDLRSLGEGLLVGAGFVAVRPIFTGLMSILIFRYTDIQFDWTGAWFDYLFFFDGSDLYGSLDLILTFTAWVAIVGLVLQTLARKQVRWFFIGWFFSFAMIGAAYIATAYRELLWRETVHLLSGMIGVTILYLLHRRDRGPAAGLESSVTLESGA